jgi:hypothetical protein
VDCEILAKGRKGLLVYGSLHVLHGAGDSFVTSLDRQYPGRVRALIGSLRPEESTSRLRSTLSLGPDPSLVLLAGTALANWSFYQTIGFTEERSELTLGEAVDGVLYFGAVEDRVVPRDPAVLEDPEYRAQRIGRDALRREFGEIVAREGWSGMRQYEDYTCG